jgi:hypothetical protein
MSAYDFSCLIRDKGFPQNVVDSHIYIIGQRREITFNDFNFISNKGIIEFTIKQKENPNILECTLPIFQKHIAINPKTGIDIKIANRSKKREEEHEFPFNGTQAIIFEEVNDKTNYRKLIIWFSPEKLLQNYWKGYIDMKIVGDFKKLLKYQVHYVGKSTEQNICNRLSNHSTFQQILINQDALTYGNIPSNEIAILLFRLKNNNSITKWDKHSTDEDMLNYLLKYRLPSHKVVSLDAEKALIKHLNPKYNKVIYKSYPTKKDLLNKDIHNNILYSFNDPITLIYQDGQIKGSEYMNDRDYISVK